MGDGEAERLTSWKFERLGLAVAALVKVAVWLFLGYKIEQENVNVALGSFESTASQYRGIEATP